MVLLIHSVEWSLLKPRRQSTAFATGDAMSFDNNRGNGELQRDYYNNGNIAAGAEMARRGIDEMNARASQPGISSPGVGGGDLPISLILGAAASFAAYWAAMTFLPAVVSVPIHNFLGSAIPLAIIAGIALVAIVFAVKAVIVITQVVWQVLKIALVLGALFVVWTLAFNVYSWLAH
jgi:hypothetical protein